MRSPEDTVEHETTRVHLTPVGSKSVLPGQYRPVPCKTLPDWRAATEDKEVDPVHSSGPPTGSNIAAAPVDHLQLPLPLVARQESDARPWLRAYACLLNEQYRILRGAIRHVPQVLSIVVLPKSQPFPGGP